MLADELEPGRAPERSRLVGHPNGGHARPPASAAVSWPALIGLTGVA